MKTIIIHDEQISNKVAESAKQILKDQEEFTNALCNFGEEILSFVKSYDIKQPILQEIQQHNQKGWYRKFEKRKWQIQK